jgi:hypothetical protein
MKKVNKTFYHGSPVKINDGIIRVRPGHINSGTTAITAVFATPDFAHARLYAAMRYISDGWGSPHDGNTLFVQKIKPCISDMAYIYELDSDEFEQDGNSNEYYSLKDKEVKRVIEIDVLEEIISGNIKIYVLQNEIDFSDKSHREATDLWLKTLKENTFKPYKPD